MENPDDIMTCLRFTDEEHRFLHAAVPPIYETGPFFFDSYDAYAEAANNEMNHYVYWRGTNPTVQIAENMLAELEGGEAGKCFASGMAAIGAALLCSVGAGDHVILIGHVYETSATLVQYLAKFHITYTTIHSVSVEAVASAIEDRTKVILMESPTSYTFDLVNIPEITQLARSRDIRTIIDNSWATPLYMKPLRLGVDIVVHSVSKYLGGHNDLVGGAMIASRDIISRMFTEEFQLMGASMAPFEAWLLIRGLRTLPLRMKAHEQNGLEIARYLDSHPAVSRVNHPGLPSHPQYELGRKLLRGYSGLFSFELKAPGYGGIRSFMNKLKLFRIGVSWGAMESQIISPNYGYNESALTKQQMPLSLVRLAAGHEPAQLLIQDLEEALRYS
ncbi:PLP-dependent aspartate aminotransferase family protein [Paenibacillus sp. J22TS3]|uniref:trans-sulfuration enzyme family protein n=1 Tax=Paenibacillus sp. J22TS3 TaxID=2807192 RepID=UPI001BCD033A|nr:aminotransferase class I/II-fold pyridoxal phosphate-dependent enzyme [Paenibacillus sp. J22TS3]